MAGLGVFPVVNEALAAAPTERPPLVASNPEGLVGTVARRLPRRPCDACRPAKLHDLLGKRCARQGCATSSAASSAWNEKQLAKKLVADLELPEGLFVWRRKSAWNNHAIIRSYISLLARRFGDIVRERYVIVLVDVYRSHIESSIFQHAR